LIFHSGFAGAVNYRFLPCPRAPDGYPPVHREKQIPINDSLAARKSQQQRRRAQQQSSRKQKLKRADGVSGEGNSSFREHFILPAGSL
jgi:hypothetical protein